MVQSGCSGMVMWRLLNGDNTFYILCKLNGMRTDYKSSIQTDEFCIRSPRMHARRSQENRTIVHAEDFRWHTQLLSWVSVWMMSSVARFSTTNAVMRGWGMDGGKQRIPSHRVKLAVSLWLWLNPVVEPSKNSERASKSKPLLLLEDFHLCSS